MPHNINTHIKHCDLKIGLGYRGFIKCSELLSTTAPKKGQHQHKGIFLERGSKSSEFDRETV